MNIMELEPPIYVIELRKNIMELKLSVYERNNKRMLWNWNYLYIWRNYKWIFWNYQYMQRNYKWIFWNWNYLYIQLYYKLSSITIFSFTKERIFDIKNCNNGSVNEYSFSTMTYKINNIRKYYYILLLYFKGFYYISQKNSSI